VHDFILKTECLSLTVAGTARTISNTTLVRPDYLQSYVLQLHR